MWRFCHQLRALGKLFSFSEKPDKLNENKYCNDKVVIIKIKPRRVIFPTVIHNEYKQRQMPVTVALSNPSRTFIVFFGPFISLLFMCEYYKTNGKEWYIIISLQSNLLRSSDKMNEYISFIHVICSSKVSFSAAMVCGIIQTQGNWDNSKQKK